MISPRSPLRGLYAVTDASLTPGERLVPAVSAALHGGARLIQYRDKSTDPVRREQEAHALVSLCREHGVPLIINDDVTLAMRVGADGVHLGEDDAALADARVRLGPRAIIGVSCYNRLDRALRAAHEGADYVAFGRFHPSSTKPGAVEAPLSLLEEARRTLAIPLCAIGGITAENGGELVAAGADMLAVIRGVFGTPDPGVAAHRYARLFD